MRSALLALLFCTSAHAAQLDGIPITIPSEGVPDVLMRDSFICNDPRLLLETKELTLAGFATKDVSAVNRQISKGNCDVTTRDKHVTITRLVRGYLKGIDGTMTAEILLEVKKEGEYIGWTESVNLEVSAPLYEDAKTRMNEELRKSQ